MRKVNNFSAPVPMASGRVADYLPPVPSTDYRSRAMRVRDWCLAMGCGSDWCDDNVAAIVESLGGNRRWTA